MRRLSALSFLLLTAAVGPSTDIDIHVVPPGTVAVVNTIQLCSTSGSTVAANTPSPPMFPVEFRKGDIPAGQYPKLQAADGTPWGATFINVRHWSDGSMKIAGVLPGPFPKAIPTGCAAANVLSGGSAPAASGLTTAQLYSELIQLNANGFAGALGSGLSHSGNWAAKLANDANNVEVVNYGDGQGGRVYRILTHVQQSGTPHGQMEVYWYVQQLLNASGGVAGYRVLPRLTQPWYNNDTPAKDWRGLQTFNVQYGASPTTVTPPFPYQPLDLQASKWSVGTDFLPAVGPASWVTGNSGTEVPGYFTTTETLPAGWNLNQVYCARYYPDAGSLTRIGACANVFDSVPTPPNGGAGTHTFHPIPLLLHFGTLWGAGADGRPLYLQGSGTVSFDAPILIKRDPVYDQSTKLWPPYDMSLSPTPAANNSLQVPFSSAPIAFDINTSGPIGTALNQGGERDPIGIRTAYCARWFYNRTLVDEKYVRVNGLISGLFANSIRDVTTHGPIHVGDPAKSYTGMPASSATTFQWNAVGIQGLTLPAHGRTALHFTVNDASHMPDLAGCAYLATGEPQYLDLQMEWANQGIAQFGPSERNATVGGANFYGAVTNTTQNLFRLMAWALRPIVDASAWWPDTDPAGTQIGTYLNDQRSASTHLPTVSIPLENNWAASNCYWMPPGGGTRGAWNYAYMVNTLVDAANAAEDSDALSLLNCSATWYNHVLNVFGGYSLYSYFDITAYDDGGHSTGQFMDASFSWSSGTATMTLISTGAGSLFTGETLSVGAGAYSGAHTITVTSPTTATFPLDPNPGGSTTGLVIPVGNLNSSDATYSTSWGLSPNTSISYLGWHSGTPGSIAVLFTDYSAYGPPYRPGGQSWNPANGDKFIFPPVTPGIQPATAPGGLTVQTPYYTVNTHAGPISNTTWSSGTLTVTATTAHGIPAGTYAMGINGNTHIGSIYGTLLTCTVTTTTQFTCPLASDPGLPAVVHGEFNTAQLATSPGGTPLAITNSNSIHDDFGSIPSNAPSGYWIGFNEPGSYLANLRGAWSAMIASGVTGMNPVLADANTRLMYTRNYWGIGTLGDYFRSNPKNAFGTQFGSGAPPPPPPIPLPAGAHRRGGHFGRGSR
jgi:hypothetical protein